MSELASELKDRYLDEITKAFPLYRVVIFFVYILFLYSIENGAPGSVWLNVLNIQMLSVLDIDSGVLSYLHIYDFAIAGGGVVFCGVAYSWVARWLFSWFGRVLKLETIAKKFCEATNNAVGEGVLITVFVIEQQKKSIDMNKARIRRMSAYSEVAFSLAVATYIVALFGGYLDVVVAAGLTLLSFMLSISSMRVFIAKLMPAEAHLQGMIGEYYTPDMSEVIDTSKEG